MEKQVKLWGVIVTVLVFVEVVLFSLDYCDADVSVLNEFFKLEAEYCYPEWVPKEYSNITDATSESRWLVTKYQIDGGVMPMLVVNPDKASEIMQLLEPKGMSDASGFVRNWIRTNIAYDLLGQCYKGSEDYYETLAWVYGYLHFHESTMLTGRSYSLYKNNALYRTVLFFLVIISVARLIGCIRRNNDECEQRDCEEFDSDGAQQSESESKES